jgi:ATP-binding cassette subfamily A (ABC1) protein 3
MIGSVNEGGDCERLFRIGYADAISHTSLPLSFTLVFVPLLLTLGLLFPVSQMISYVCREKELRQKELLKMMSVAESDIGWSWFVSYLLVYLVVATLCSLVATQLYTNSTGLMLWIFWVFTFVALIVFSMMIASLSAKTTRVSK